MFLETNIIILYKPYACNLFNNKLIALIILQLKKKKTSMLQLFIKKPHQKPWR